MLTFPKPFRANIAVLVCLSLIFSSAVLAEPSSRIVGGNNATNGEYPFMVALADKGSGTLASRQFCGGSLIHPKWVLTAAHCVPSSTTASSIIAGIGLHNLETDTGEQIEIERIIAHPNYDSNTNDNDIALLELKTSSVTGTPINIVSSSTNLTGMTSTAIGWGLTSEGGSPSAILQEVELPVVSNTTCNASYGNITSNMVCAGYAGGGKDACQGDSGGPLIIGGSAAPQLIGATSFGTGCARPGFYGVWARVAEYLSWINTYVTFASETDGPFGLWNGFIDIVGVAELRNDSGSAVTAQVNLFNISGNLISSTMFSVGANSQQDVIINQLAGFKKDSYGVVRVSNNVSGRIFYYRPIGGGFSDFEFAFGIPLTDGMTGTRYVGFNTYQPSSNPSEQGNLVANWLSVVNLEKTSRNFTINKYSMSGSLISSQGITLGGRQRADLDGGHTSPGANNVGLLEVVPQDGSSIYIAQLVRYGYSTSGTSFEFAFPLLPLPGYTSAIVVPIGSTFSVQNWLEVINTSNSSQVANVDIYNSSGVNVHSQSVSLGALAQAHINLTNFLGSGVSGQAVITPGASRSIVSEAMFYYHDSATGSIDAMYGSQASLARALDVVGTFNLFLSMQNYLKVTNPGNSTISVDFEVSSLFSSGSNFSRNIGARESINIELHDFSTYGTIANSYGTVTVRPGSNAVQTEILRIKPTTGGLQFAAPTELQ